MAENKKLTVEQLKDLFLQVLEIRDHGYKFSEIVIDGFRFSLDAEGIPEMLSDFQAV